MLLQRDIVGRFVKYSFVGCMSVGIYFLFVYILIERYQWGPVIGSAVAFIIMTIFSFLLNVRFTFQSSFTQQKLWRFLCVSFIGFVLNFILIFGTVHILSFHYLVGEVVTIFVIPLVNFLLNYYWTFQTK